MKKQKRCLFWCIATVLLCASFRQTASAEDFIPGGSAEQPAIAAYETWMQFETPDTNTPAIDEDGCLNYALAKMSVRYNLPVPGVDALTDSYTYYTTFTETILQPGMPKMERIAEQYADYLTRGESVWLSGTAEERMEQAYTVCIENGTGSEWSYILQMTTASGSDHYVLVDTVNLTEQRLYLLDSGSWYIRYLGDEKSTEKGYSIVAVHPYYIRTVPGDLDGDLRLTKTDAELVLQKSKSEQYNGDANHDGKVDTADAVYLAHIAKYETSQTVQCALQSDDIVPETATSITTMKKTPPTELLTVSDKWNSQIFQKQLEK